MIVAATTDCFREMPLMAAFERINDLEYANVEISISAGSKHITPVDVLNDTEKAVGLCRDTHRLNIVGYSLNINAQGDDYYRQFAACCRLAKATKVVSLTVPSAELGTPFNEEVERLRMLVDIAMAESAVVSIRSQVGCLSEDPDTVGVLCNNVRGLGVTLDPSHYLYQCETPRDYEPILKNVYHVHLRDTTKDELQVRVGQGEVDYGKLLNQLRKVKYDRALTVNLAPAEDVDHTAEMRKIRLLLESLI